MLGLFSQVLVGHVSPGCGWSCFVIMLSRTTNENRSSKDRTSIKHLSNIFRTSFEHRSKIYGTSIVHLSSEPRFGLRPTWAPPHQSSTLLHTPPMQVLVLFLGTPSHGHRAARCIPHPVLGGGVHHLLNVLPLSAWAWGFLGHRPARSSLSNECLSNIYRASIEHLSDIQ